MRRAPRRYFFWAWTGTSVAGLSLLASACGASGAEAAKAPEPSKAEVALTCSRVADVLSDGPDPTADPVGYALAQVLPLRQITTGDRALKSDIDALASAYEAVYKSGGGKGTEAAVDRAGRRVDTICPGAF